MQKVPYMKLYFNEIETDLSSKTFNLMFQSLKKYFQDNKELYHNCRYVEFKICNFYDEKVKKSIEREIKSNPSVVLSLLAMAAHSAYEGENAPRGELFHVGIVDYELQMNIQDLKSNNVNTFVKVRGFVKDVSFIDSIIVECNVVCKKCGKEYYYNKNNSFCPKCKNLKFKIIDKNPIIKNRQRFIIQQIESEHQLICDLDGILVDSVRIGDFVDVTGIIHFENLDRIFKLSIQVNHVNLLINSIGFYADSFISKSDISDLIKISNDEQIFPKLVYSFNSYFEPIFRAAILLLLFSTFDDPLHILITNPCNEIIGTIRKIYKHIICIDDASKTEVQTKVQKNWYRGGALAQSNMGILIFNDIEKFNKSQEILLDVLESHEETIDSFHKIKTKFSSLIFCEQRLFIPALLEKVTLILDIPEEKMTNKIITPRTLRKFNGFERWNDKFLPLSERLKCDNTVFEGFNEELLTKYIIYARQFVKVHWCKSAIQHLQEVSDDFETLHKLKVLSQCRARMELRDIIQNSDIDESLELIYECQLSNKNKKKKVPKENSKKKFLFLFMDEFKKIAKYKENGNLSDKEIEEIANLLNYQKYYMSIEHLIETLQMNNLILSSTPHFYRLRNQSL